MYNCVYNKIQFMNKGEIKSLQICKKILFVQMNPTKTLVQAARMTNWLGKVCLPLFKLQLTPFVMWPSRHKVESRSL